MAPKRLFIDPNSEELDVERLVFESKPIALILLVFGGIGVAFFVLAQLFQYVPLFQQLFLFAQQLTFALGGFVALLYVLVRASQFAGRTGGTDGPELEGGSTPPRSATSQDDSAGSRHEIPVRDKNRTTDDRTTPSEVDGEESATETGDGGDDRSGAGGDDETDETDTLDGDDETDRR